MTEVVEHLPTSMSSDSSTTKRKINYKTSLLKKKKKLNDKSKTRK
jgi:hypothetical protein